MYETPGGYHAGWAAGVQADQSMGGSQRSPASTRQQRAVTACCLWEGNIKGLCIILGADSPAACMVGKELGATVDTKQIAEWCRQTCSVGHVGGRLSTWGGENGSSPASNAKPFSKDVPRVERLGVSMGGDEKLRIVCGGLGEGLMGLVGHWGKVAQSSRTGKVTAKKKVSF